MSATSASSLKKHIIEHEILGITTGGTGSITILDGFPTYIDTTRGNKILSINRSTFVASKKDKAQDIFLRVPDSIATSKSSYRMFHNGTITGLSIQGSAISTYNLHIYRNDILVPLVTLSSITSGTHSNFLNVDVDESDTIQFYIEGTCHNPVVWLEIAWRF